MHLAPTCAPGSITFQPSHPPPPPPPTMTLSTHRDSVVGKRLGKPLVSQAAHPPAGGDDPIDGRSLVAAVPPHALQCRQYR